METISFIFDEMKAAQAAAYLLSLHEAPMNDISLMTLLYFSDRLSLEKYHSTITTDSYFSMKSGPIPSGIYDYLKHNESTDIWKSYIKKANQYSVRSAKKMDDADFDCLSIEDKEILSSVYDKYKNTDQLELSKISHTFPEWQNPGNSRSPISIESILQATIDCPDELKDAERELKLASFLNNENIRNKESET